MNRNDYRRALIMLRGLSGRMTGHARLERRTLMATLQFTVNGDAGASTLYAVLIGNKNGRYYTANLGAIGSDRPLQYGALFQFDPRNIDRRMLEDYMIIGVANDGGELIMSGFLLGSREVDWLAVDRCIAERFDAQPAPMPALEPMQTAGFFVGDPPNLADGQMAIDALADVEWPDSALSVKPLFERQSAFIPFDAPGYVFVREGDGIVGLKAVDNQLTTLCYGVAGESSAAPPEGLLGYTWRDGYWIICIDLLTGEPIEI